MLKAYFLVFIESMQVWLFLVGTLDVVFTSAMKFKTENGTIYEGPVKMWKGIFFLDFLWTFSRHNYTQFISVFNGKNTKIKEFLTKYLVEGKVQISNPVYFMLYLLEWQSIIFWANMIASLIELSALKLGVWRFKDET